MAESSSTPEAQRRALTPYQMPRAQLMDWKAWPATTVRIAGQSVQVMGVHLTDKQDTGRAPCIRMMLRVFAPRYREEAGFGVLRSAYENGRPLQMKVSRVLKATVASHASGQYYLINLDRLRDSRFWQRRYALYQGNLRGTSDPRSPAVHFERMVLNILRASAYTPDAMLPADRPKFIQASVEALARQGADCRAQPAQPVCVLNAIFMETELGSAHPLAVTDALDNSGLAFGPRQLDLGQGRRDAAEFARRYLLAPEERAENWDQRYLRPVEAMTVRDFRQLHKDVIPTLNSRLLDSGDAVVDLYASGLLQLVRQDYGLGGLRLEAATRNLATLIASDFSNKWGEGNARGIVRALRNRASAPASYSDCSFYQAWRKQVQQRYGFADLEDFKRRSVQVLRYWEQASGQPVRRCAAD